ncbi:outer membrane lipoprotein carrier protein LolA [Virgibacillus xinjiangensis]|uniref:Outer membrane lipoprotein carrier protein LolA n=1 Tax=Virgibacillus xinjiangensis TaxID=393090 RepID=A0ABV7CSN6_9BACI
MSMKSIRNMMIMMLGLVFVLAACGEKSQEDVVSKLQDNLEDMSGYKAKAEMVMSTGQEDQVFQIDIWHKKEDMYRVSLTSDQEEKGNQIILKNEDGVFVLTPALNKSFKFQSEWPENSSQPYLYQSLVNDVSTDEEASFEATDTHYIFTTKTNYQSNNNLPYQEIHIDKDNYTPTLVKVMDKDRNALVQVSFSEFEMDPEFGEDDFSMDKNMTTSASDTPVSGQGDQDTMEVVYPTFAAGAELEEEKEVDLDNGKRVIMTYTGEKNFTLIEETAETLPTLSSPEPVNGDIVNLGAAVAAITDNRIEWHHNGVDYTVASEDLTREEFIEVARSVQGREVK